MNLKEANTHGNLSFPLQVYSHKDKNHLYTVPQHWHPELEFIFVEYGLLEVTINGTNYHLTGSTCCFVNGGELHEIRSIGASLHHAIVFHPKMLEFAYPDTSQEDIIRPVAEQQWLFPPILPKHAEHIRSRIADSIQAVAGHYRTQSPLSALAIRIQLLQIICEFSQEELFVPNELTLETIKSRERVKEVILYIREHYRNAISLSELSQIACMSQSYFCRYFKKETGKTPISFINEYRIQQAAKQLLNTDFSVMDVAFSCGFDNFSYFIKKFKEYKGVTPKQFQLFQKTYDPSAFDAKSATLTY